MPKKVKRQTSKSAATNGAAYVPSNTAAIANAVSMSRSSEREFNPDYSHTIKDLKRIGMLASGFLVVLIVLSFFLR